MKWNLLIVLLCTSMSSNSLQASRIGQLSNNVCTVREKSIFGTCGIERTEDGTLSKGDLTVEGFAVGDATLDEVAQRFPGVRRFRLTREEESSVGLCVKNTHGQAVVFASGYAGGWKVLDSIYIAQASTLEGQGAKCLVEQSLGLTLSTRSGIRLGMTRDRVVSILQSIKGNSPAFQISFVTSPAKAPWVSQKIRPKSGEDWVAMSGATGEFRMGLLRWIAVYGAVSN